MKITVETIVDAPIDAVWRSYSDNFTRYVEASRLT